MTDAIDWKAAMDGTRPVTTRDGQKVKLYCVDAPGKYPVHGGLYNSNGDCLATAWTKAGRWQIHSAGNVVLDLIQPPPAPKTFRREFWLNVYNDNSPLTARVGDPYLTKADAMEAVGDTNNRIACVRVVVEGKEGDGLS